MDFLAIVRLTKYADGRSPMLEPATGQAAPTSAPAIGDAVETPNASTVSPRESSLAAAEKGLRQRVPARLRRIRKMLGYLWKIAVGVAVAVTAVVTLGVAGYAIALSLFKNSITIEPISTPKSLVESGYTPEVAASELKNAMSRAMSAIQAPGPQMALRADQPDVAVPSVNVSAQTIVSSARKFLPFLEAKVITGEVTIADDKLWLTLRFAGNEIYSNSRGANPQKFRQLMDAAAPVVLRKIWPLYSAIETARSNPQFALQAADRIIATGSSADISQAYLVKGAIEATTSNCDGALRSFDTLLHRDIHPDLAIQAHLGRAIALGCLARPTEAEIEVGRASFLAKGEPRYMLIIHALQRQPASVIVSDATAFLAKHGQEPYAYNLIGDLVVQWNMPTEAITFYETALRTDPDDLITRANLGSAYLDAGRISDGFASYRKAIEINPHDERLFDVHANLANRLRELGRLEEAEAEYRAILETPLPTSFQRFGGNPRNASSNIDVHVRARNGLVGVLREQKKFDAAMAELNRNIDFEPGNADARIELAFIERDQGRAGNARQSFQKAIDLAPNSPAAHYFFGSFLRGQGNFDEAITQLQRAIELAPIGERQNVSNAHHEIGLAKLGQQKFDDALGSVKRAIDLGKTVPGNELNGSIFHVSLAQVYRAQERNDDAVVALKEAVRLDPDATEPHRQLAEVFLALKQPDDAIAQRRIVVEKVPRDARASFDLANTLQLNGNLDESAQIFRSLYDQDSKSLDSIFNLASVTIEQARQRGNAERPVLLAQACKLVQDGLQSSPKDNDFISARERLNQLLPRRHHCTSRRSRHG